NARFGLVFRVENYGIDAAMAYQQTARLRDTLIGPDDTVIFYDGVNDVDLPIEHGEPQGLRTIEDRAPKTFVDDRLIARLHRFLEAARIPCSILTVAEGLKKPAPMPGLRCSQAELQGRLRAMATNYYQAQMQAKACVEKYRGHFFHFLQPTI